MALIKKLRHDEMEEKNRKTQEKENGQAESKANNVNLTVEKSTTEQSTSQVQVTTPGEGQDAQNDQFLDEYFEHDYEDEEQLFNVLHSHKLVKGALAQVKRLINDSNQQIQLTIQNKKEELNYLFESQTKEL